MSRYIDADAFLKEYCEPYPHIYKAMSRAMADAPSIEIVRCQDCKKSHIDGKTTHYLWCVEWGRSTDVFGYCERGEREGE